MGSIIAYGDQCETVDLLGGWREDHLTLSFFSP